MLLKQAEMKNTNVTYKMHELAALLICVCRQLVGSILLHTLFVLQIINNIIYRSTILISKVQIEDTHSKDAKGD